MDAPSTSTSTFTLFPQLPTELRLKIWKSLLPGPRVVTIRFNRGAQQYTSSTTAPVLLRTHPESRAAALETYTNLILSPSFGSCVFVDFARDTLFFDSLDCSPRGDLAFDLATSPHRDRILACAIDVQLWEVLRVFRYESLSELQWLGNLRTVALVMPKEREKERGLLGRVAGEGERDARDVRDEERLGGGDERRLGDGDGDGGGRLVVESDADLFSAEIRHSYWYVECLRGELEKDRTKHWGSGIPNVQMWLW